ncbi:MAG: 7TM-DISM domain-containing protein, partial [Leptospirales bacterium]
MNWLRYLQTLGVFIWVCHGLQAKTGLSPVTLTLTNTNDVALPGRSSCAIRDPTFNMSFEQLRAGESELSCEANDRALPSFGLAGAAIWLRFQVVNRTDESFW